MGDAARIRRVRARRELTPSLFARPGPYETVHTDAFEWLATAPRSSIHAVVTDPPYGLLEYRRDQIEKMKRGRGGVWRIPPLSMGAGTVHFPGSRCCASASGQTCGRSSSALRSG